MKKSLIILALFFALTLFGCKQNAPTYDIVATTLPVYNFTAHLCQGSDLQVGQLVTENVSCLHDYTLDVDQMQAIEQADVVVLSGAGLEDFMEDALDGADYVIDSAEGAHIHEGGHAHHHEYDHSHDAHHSHAQDPHIWLSPENAAIMATNICEGLCSHYPQYSELFRVNLQTLTEQLRVLRQYADRELDGLCCTELITFHDGFGYFAESFGLTVLEAVEEESGSEASAAELIHLIQLVNEHDLPAVFTEVNGSDAAASVIARETGSKVYPLDMAMSGDSYFTAMYHNIDTIKEALG